MNIIDAANRVYDNNGIISENNPNVYESGYNKGKDDGIALGYDSGYSQAESDFWDSVQNRGQRTNYEYAFSRWGREYIRPLYKYVHGGGTTNRILFMFSNNKNLKKVEKKYFDLSAYIPSTTAENGSSVYNVFQSCSNLEEIEDIGIQGGGYYYTFYGNSKLHTIEVMRCVKNGQYSGVFNGCSALENITIEGEIGNDLSFKNSPLLTIESLKSITNALVDTGTTHTLTLHTNALARLEAEESSAIATANSKNWTITA